MSKGVDCTSPIRATVLKSEGIEFIARYLSHSSWKNLKQTEVEDYKANGIKLVVVWETDADRVLSGMSAGSDDAQSAVDMLKSLGLDGTQAVYFAVDFDADESQQRIINAYFIGVASVLKKEKIGVYGGYYVVKRLLDAGYVTYAWQTLAWSGGQWDERAQIRQTNIDTDYVGGVSVDRDESTTDDYGQF